MNTPRFLTICIAGADADVTARLGSLLDEQRARLDSPWQIGPHASADLLVIDSDSLYGHMDWLKASASGRLVASWSHAPEAADDSLRLRQPILADDLVALLNRANQRLRGATAAAEPAPVRAADPIPPPARAAAPQVVATAADTAATENPNPVVATLEASATAAVTPPRRGLRLVDLLDADSPLKGRLRLAADGLPTLFLDPHHRTWHAESTLKGLSAWCSRALSSTDVHSAEDAQWPAVTTNAPAQPYARLKWLAHLVEGQGQLDPELDQDTRYKLARWPQSEREFPKHFRIATMMLKQSSSVDEVASQTGSTRAEVVDFINAYNAIGYIEQDQPESPLDEARRSGLFGRGRRISAN